VLKDERMRTAVGASHYTSSLHDAVQACLEAAQKAVHEAAAEPAIGTHGENAIAAE
jgi:hypothetical protein